MPQLITVPYNHIYVVVTFVLMFSFFLFSKYLLPSVLLLTKVTLKTLLIHTKKSLFYLHIIGLPFMVLNLCSIYMNSISFCVDIVFNKMLSCLCRDYIQHIYLCKYSNNNIYGNVLHDILLENYLDVDGSI